MLRFIIQMREKYDPSTSKKITQYINSSKKVIKSKLSIEFINKCLHIEKMANFSRINLHNHYTNSFTLLGKKITLSTFYEINNNTNNNW